MRCLNWADFKSVCITKKNLNIQYEDLGTQYHIIGPDANNISWEIILDKLLANGDANPDATDFEDNVEPDCNWPIGSRSYAFSSSDFEFDGDGVIGTCTADGTLTLDYQVDANLHPVGQNLNGGVLIISGGAHGDWIECSVVDAGNLLPAPYTGATLKTWVKKWYVPTDGNVQLQTPYAGRIPARMYLRAIYHSTGATDVKVAMNYFLHTPI